LQKTGILLLLEQLRVQMNCFRKKHFRNLPEQTLMKDLQTKTLQLPPEQALMKDLQTKILHLPPERVRMVLQMKIHPQSLELQQMKCFRMRILLVPPELRLPLPWNHRTKIRLHLNYFLKM
jgi:hypothetical protein